MRERFVVAALAVTLGVATFVACRRPMPQVPPPPPPIVDAGPAEAEAPPPPPAPKTVYERLGTKDGLAAIVKATVAEAASHKDSEKAFSKLKDDKLERFRQALEAELCAAASGGCAAGDKDVEALRVVRLTEKQFAAFVECFSGALDAAKVEEADKTDLLLVLARLKETFVDAKKGRH